MLLLVLVSFATAAATVGGGEEPQKATRLLHDTATRPDGNILHFRQRRINIMFAAVIPLCVYEPVVIAQANVREKIAKLTWGMRKED